MGDLGGFYPFLASSRLEREGGSGERDWDWGKRRGEEERGDEPKSGRLGLVGLGSEGETDRPNGRIFFTRNARSKCVILARNKFIFVRKPNYQIQQVSKLKIGAIQVT